MSATRHGRVLRRRLGVGRGSGLLARAARATALFLRRGGFGDLGGVGSLNKRGLRLGESRVSIGNRRGIGVGLSHGRGHRRGSNRLRTLAVLSRRGLPRNRLGLGLDTALIAYATATATLLLRRGRRLGLVDGLPRGPCDGIGDRLDRRLARAFRVGRRIGRRPGPGDDLSRIGRARHADLRRLAGLGNPQHELLARPVLDLDRLQRQLANRGPELVFLLGVLAAAANDAVHVGGLDGLARDANERARDGTGLAAQVRRQRRNERSGKKIDVIALLFGELTSHKEGPFS